MALIAGHAAPAASLESTSATTTYHRETVDGVGVFYREAGPKDAPTIVLLHGFPSSSREFDTLIPLLATRYHLIAPDFPGFGQSVAPPPSSYPYTFDHLAKTIDGLLEQLNVAKCSFYLHDYGVAVGFRIILAHPERVQALIIQNANAYKEGLGAKWAGIAQSWADPKAHPEVFDGFVSFAANSVIRSAPRIPTVTIPTLGPMNTLTSRSPGSGKSRPLCSTTTGRMSPHIRRGKRGCASTGHRHWWSGDETIPRSLPLVERLTSAICRMPRSICSTPAISLWMKRTTRSLVLFLRSWPTTPADTGARATRSRLYYGRKRLLHLPRAERPVLPNTSLTKPE
jgi:pimeloyl-ACP methyl ester carboxylesterase